MKSFLFKGGYCIDDESDTSTIMNEDVSQQVPYYEESFDGNLEENQTIDVKHKNLEIGKSSGYNSTQYAHAGQIHLRNKDNLEDSDHQAILLKLRIAGKIFNII